MPFLTRIASHEFDEFEQALVGINGRHVLVARAAGLWTLEILALDGVSLMRGRNAARSIYQGACAAGTFLLFVPLANPTGMILNGKALSLDTFGICPPGFDNRLPSSQDMQWAAVTIEGNAIFERAGKTAEIAAPIRGHEFRAGVVPALARERLVRLVQSAFRIANANAGTFEARETREHLRRELIDASIAAVEAMSADQAPVRGRPPMDRASIMDRVLADIDDRIGEPLLIGDLCSRAGVSAATLQTLFHERMDISPHRYLMLRRVHAIRDALRHASADETVSTVCCRFGVWEFGRLAALYKQQFGVSPGVTLRCRRAQLGVDAAEDGRP